MANKLRTAVLWLTLAQVALVGSVGTGLHGLFGCEHAGCCTAACCSQATPTSSQSGCEDCVFCRRARERKAAHRLTEATLRNASQPSNPAACDGCVVCNLLDQYHNGACFALAPLAIARSPELPTFPPQDEAPAASILRAFSRGPPTV